MKKAKKKETKNTEISEPQTGNISRLRRDELVEKLGEIKAFLEKSSDENAERLLRFAAELEREVGDKNFGLVFEEHRENIDVILEENLPVLTEEKKRFLTSENTSDDSPLNFIIEGDNLAALKLLLKTHRGRIDLIYIDPPYNTGNKDFIYNDSYVDKTDTFRHSKWLSFMKKRLEIAQCLMSDKGVIFISIDDNEQAQLKFLCDDIFGENNHLATIHWRKNRKPHNAGNKMSVSYEFIHVYFKRKPVKMVQDYAEMFEDEKGKYAEYPIVKADKRVRTYTFVRGIPCRGVFRKGRTKTARNDKCNLDILDEPIIKNGMLMNDIRVSGRFCLTDERKKLSEAMSQGNIFFTKGGVPKEKRYRSDDDSKIDTNYWDLQNGKNEDGDEELVSIFDLPGENTIFDHPKPVKLLQRVLTDYGDKHALVLDFFAGSGTTGHAVMLQNEEDSGTRNFILVTNNENGICEKVTYERLKRVMKKEKYNARLKYMKIGYHDISGKLYYEYADDLLKHIRELVELENAVDFAHEKSLAIVLTQKELDALVKNDARISKCKVVYVGHDVTTTGSAKKAFAKYGIEKREIPEYYYPELEK